MSTRVYGSSDDLIEFEGDFRGEVGAYKEKMVVMSDGTLLRVSYGKEEAGIWEIEVLRKGSLFEKLEICTDANDLPYSDVAHFGHGIVWAYVAEDWERVQ